MINRIAFILVSSVALTGCDASFVGGGVSSIPNPGVTFFDAGQRMEFLRTRTCEPYRPPSLASFQPRTVIGGQGWAGFDTHGFEFGQAVNAVAMLYLDTGEERYAADAIRNLRRFADADGLKLGGNIHSAAYANAQATQFLLPAWQVLLEYPGLAPDDKEAIEGWLARLVTRVMQEEPARNNHMTSQGMTLVLAGAILDRPDWFRRGIRIAQDQIQQIRPDGSFPLEAERGQWAVVYTSRNIAHLITIFETARAQGIDLYSYAPNGRTLDDAIRFMLAARRDNSLIDGYARANRFTPADYAVFRPNAQRDPFDGHDTSWVPVYANRFPGTDLTRELRRLKPATENQGIHYSPVGGNVTCMVGY